MEGEEWKNAGNNRTSPDNIAIDEYTSILQSFYEAVLRPIVQKGQKIDRDALDVIASELEWKIKDKDFGKLPFKTQNAYKSLAQLSDTLKNTDDATIVSQRELLQGHFNLGICCTSYGDSMKDIYLGRNPCRNSQVEMYSALSKARRASEERGISLPIIEASGQMFDVCKKCPYK